MLIIIIIGKIKVISTSKIKKIIVIKKNRSEKGSREEDLGSNPHSKGDLFSRSAKVFLDKIEASNITIIEIVIIIDLIVKIVKIIYTITLIDLMIGSHIYFILYKYLSSSSIDRYIKK